MTELRGFLLELAKVSERAALIARACRKERDLFRLLIEEKTGDSKNAKMKRDFKTLADVLIQETVRHHLGSKYPVLTDQIFGEESNSFTNTLGESISVKILSLSSETSLLLNRVLDGNKRAADLLASQVHTEDLSIDSDCQGYIESSIPSDMTIDLDNVGIWIDPIDSTSNYIKGKKMSNGDILCQNGLNVVTVLIGAFDRKTGLPVVGVVNRPFAIHEEESQNWIGKIYWGLSFDGFKKSYLPPAKKEAEILIGSREDDKLISILKSKYDRVIIVQGAGYKILSVALGLADLYVASKKTTYKWDSCAAHGILSGIDGGCSEFFGSSELKYNSPNKGASGVAKWSNANGIIAYRDSNDVIKLRGILDEHNFFQ